MPRRIRAAAAAGLPKTCKPLKNYTNSQEIQMLTDLTLAANGLRLWNAQ
jgi:hypothetical protein